MQRLLGCLCLVGAVFFGLLAFFEWRFDDVLDRGTDVHVVAATVTGLPSCPGRGCGTDATVRFRTVAGREVTTVMTKVYLEQEPRVGDRITVRYSERDPEQYVRDERRGSEFSGVVLATILALGLGGLGVAGVLGRGPEWQFGRG